MESLLDDDDYSSDDMSATASTMEPNEVNMIRKQLEGLETMYSEVRLYYHLCIIRGFQNKYTNKKISTVH